MKYSFFVLPFVVIGCATAKKGTQPLPEVDAVIQEVKQQYAPDSRTVSFSVTATGNKIVGYTNQPAAKAALWQRLDRLNKQFIDSVEVLPAASLQNKHFAAVTISVANLRTQPRHPAELATQALFGTPLKVWKKEKGWYLVQTPDQYIAWVDGSAIALLDSAQYQQWKQQPKLVYTEPYGFAYTTPAAGSATVSDLVFGSLLDVTGERDGFYEVRFPDQRVAFVPKANALPYTQWTASRQPTSASLVETAKRLMGLPYLWGGTSVKGVDCSGFTKTVYLMNGLVLARDASQQVHMGEEVDTKSGWQNLQPGDLLFFGARAKDGQPERVVHVGMWIGGNAEFIHSAGMVHISSFNPQATNYDEGEHKRFLRARRIAPQAALKDLRTVSLFE
ncbi:C40 family peptidase [Flavisolibacter tropicus]|uniref:C40 family peptidase n=1 Tax=Flavisolibacter tropicus TaxID=1492898 RepID=UPI00082A971F|nr:C40 family peptidase [Flavisolibacter tropicus]